MMAIQEQRDYGIALFEKIRFDRASARKSFTVSFVSNVTRNYRFQMPRSKTC
jgi:hypothetical protein